MSAYRPTLIEGVAALGPEWDGLFRHGPGVQSTRAWFAASAAAALAPGTSAVMAGVLGPDGPAGLVPMAASPGLGWRSLTTPYTCLFQPLVRPGREREVGAAFGRLCRQRGVTVLEALDAGWPGLAAFRAGLGRAGLQTRMFEHFGNWHEIVPDGGWAAYLQARPGTLRETIRRKSRLVAREVGMRLEWVADPGSLGAALAAYESVYARSWKEPEPYPGFNRAMVDALGPLCVLRIGVLWSGETPIAAQYWTMVDGVATVLKLAHDDGYRRFSPGTVLTAFAIGRLIEEGTREIDFGRGDDGYKQGWAGCRRPRAGLLAAAPLFASGAAALVRHDLGRAVRNVQRLIARRRPFSLK